MRQICDKTNLIAIELVSGYMYNYFVKMGKYSIPVTREANQAEMQQAAHRSGSGN